MFIDIHGCFDLALENHWIRFNPTQNVMRLYPANVPERQPYTKEQENLLLNFVKNDGTYYIYYPLIICFLETMLRASEMFGLTWSNIDFIIILLQLIIRYYIHAMKGNTNLLHQK